MINGQDQSAAYLREQGRRNLEGVPGSPRRGAPSIEPEFPARPSLADLEWFPLSRRQELAPLGDAIGWNVRGREEPEIARADYTSGYAPRSRQKLTGLTEGFKNVCERWSLDTLAMARLLHLEEEIGLSRLILSGHVPPMTGDLKDRMALVIGISIGLGDLFDDVKGAELKWLRSARSELGSLSPLEHILKGDLRNIRDVVDLLDAARGLG